MDGRRRLSCPHRSARGAEVPAPVSAMWLRVTGGVAPEPELSLVSTRKCSRVIQSASSSSSSELLS